MANHPLLEFRNINKAFPGVQALDDVSFKIHAGKVHAIVGENGAGKSTLMKILAGVYQPDAGQILWDGCPVRFPNPAAAQRQGISIIYQEFNLLPHLTVAENILLNREPHTRLGFLDLVKLNARTKELLVRLEAEIDPEAEIHTLSVAHQQLVEIAKSLSVDARVVVMDEPTASLNPKEVGRLFDIIQKMKRRGTTTIFISHRLNEVLQIADTVTVLRDGRVMATELRKNIAREKLVKLMIGRTIGEALVPLKSQTVQSPLLLEVRGLSTIRLQNVNFRLYKGEILGFSGLEGHGQRDLVRALFGLAPVKKGLVTLNGRDIKISKPRDAIHAGISFLTDDRAVEGLALNLSVRENIALPNLDALNSAGFIRIGQENKETNQIAQMIGIRTPSLEQKVRFLSGGNQQKTVVAKWLMGSPIMVMFDEPTRGIDVAAKAEIHRLIQSLANQGIGIIIVSSELPELLGICDRILVMRDGCIVSEFIDGKATEESIMLAATGMKESSYASR
jgi:ribose transport system ATP-binding protein